MPRHTYSGKYYVGDDPRTFESVHAATSLALTKATKAPDGATFYVREIGTQGVCVRVEKVEGIIHTTKIR